MPFAIHSSGLCQTAVPSVPPSPAPSPTAVPAVTHLCAPLDSASQVAASPILIDLTIDKTPLSSPTKPEKRKRTLEQENEEGNNLRKKILTKGFEWMKPQDRPNFQKRNPYQPKPTRSESPSGIDPMETDKQPPTDSLQNDHDLGQPGQERPLAPSQAAANPPASATLPNSPGSKRSPPCSRRGYSKRQQATVRGQRQNEARERLKTKKNEIILQQNAATAETTEEQEAEDYEAMGEELEAEFERDAEDIGKMAEEMENWLEQSGSE